jgi:hypothetical protein
VLCLKEKILRFSLIEVMNALTRGNQERRRRRRKRRDLNSKSHAKENARTTMRTKITNAFASFARKISPSRENADLVCGSSFSFASTRWFSSLVKALLADKTPPPPEEEKVEVLFFLMDVVASSSRLASFSIAVSMLRTIESSFWMRISGDTVDITCVLCVCVYYVRDKEVFLVEKNSLDCTHKKAQKFLSRGRKRYFTRRTRDDDET